MQGDTDFLQVDKLNFKVIAKNKNLSRIIVDYLLYVDHNPRKALELIVLCDTNWWWK